MKKFYITTAIDYVNARPHLGHAYEKVLADVLARYHRLRGEDVFFLAGTDENAQKNVQAAHDAHEDVKVFVDKNAGLFKDLCVSLSVTHDDFIRTIEERHVKVAQLVFKKLLDTGDIYKGLYEGLYCSGCEAYFTEKDLVDGTCPEHNKKPEWIKQECYFFALSKYQEFVRSLLASDRFVLPASKRKEMLNRIDTDGLRDLCVSRYGTTWGIDVPGDKNHKIYVWMDALINYVSALGYPANKKFSTYWPADVHLIGKGINWFHSVIWPALLHAAGIEAPTTVLVHGYLTVEGKKISKSLGTAIDPQVFLKKYGVDAVRYYLLREIPFGEDGDFSEKTLVARFNNELANDLGNLASRTFTMVEKYCGGKVPEGTFDQTLATQLPLSDIESHLDSFAFHNALASVWKFIHAINKYINDAKPWESETGRADILYTALDSLRVLSIVISPFIPETATKLQTSLGVKNQQWKDLAFGGLKAGTKVSKGEHLFARIKT